VNDYGIRFVRENFSRDEQMAIVLAECDLALWSERQRARCKSELPSWLDQRVPFYWMIP